MVFSYYDMFAVIAFLFLLNTERINCAVNATCQVGGTLCEDEFTECAKLFPPQAVTPGQP